MVLPMLSERSTLGLGLHVQQFLRCPSQVPFSSSWKKRTIVSASAWGSPEPLVPAPSLTSIAEMQRQIDQDLDAALLSPFTAMRRLEQRMDQQFREMDQQFDRAFADLDRAQRELDADLARSMRQLQQQEPGVKIERREERGPGSYRYFESIHIRSGSSMSITTLTPAPSTAVFNPLLLIAVVMAGAYAAITAAFNRNYDLTTYKQGGKWQLLLLWPFLLPLSKSFRQQFISALKGEKVKVLSSMEQQESSISSDGSGSTSSYTNR